MRQNTVAAGRSIAHFEENIDFLLPAGTFHPTSVPNEILRVTGEMMIARGRVEMSAVAQAAGVSRSTLYRMCGSREHLVAATIWAGGRPMLTEAVLAGRGLHGAARVVAVAESFMTQLIALKPLTKMLANEPHFMLRALLRANSCCHQGALGVMERLLQLEQALGHVELSAEPREVAEQITDIAERSTYVDVIAGNPPNTMRAREAIRRLVLSHPKRC